jgi:hypothetical protein
LVEALTSTAFGFMISVAVWPPISIHVLHKPPAAREAFAVVGIYTLISIGRSYIVRRIFNWIHAQRAAEARCFCGRPAWGMRTSDRAMLCRYHAGADR